MKKEVYKIGNLGKAIILLASSLIITVFVVILASPLWDGSSVEGNATVLVAFSLPMIGLGVYGIVEVIKMRVVVTEDSITYTNAFGSKKLRFNEIMGFRSSKDLIIIYPRRTDTAKIKINKNIGRREELLAWLGGKFEDLDVQEARAEYQEIMNDEELGFNERERTAMLGRAKRLVKIVSVLSGAAAIWTFFFSSGHEFLIPVLIALPLVSVVILVVYRGLVRLNEKKGSPHPSILASVVFSSLALTMVALRFDLMSYGSSRMLGITVGLLMTTVALGITGELNGKPIRHYIGVTIPFVLIFFAYGYGVIVTTNCFYDHQQPKVWQVEVLNKRMNEPDNEYILEVASWGQNEEGEEKILVTEEVYWRAKVGEEVSVNEKSGLWGISWYFVGDQELPNLQ